MTLPRRTPLRRGGPLPRSSLPLRHAPLSRAPFRRKPASRSPEEVRARKLLEDRSGGTCEGCRRAPATDAAHRLARSQGGAWDVVNLLHLDRDCHRWQHDQPVMARSVGWTVRCGGDPASVPVLLPVIGWALLSDDGSVLPVQIGGPL